MNFCIIISSVNSLSKDAFNCLKDVFVKILVTPTYGGHIKFLDDFVKIDFPNVLKEGKEEYKCLTTLYQTVISSVKTDLQELDIGTPEYRSLVKVSPYILQIVAQSFKAYSTANNDPQAVQFWNDAIGDIFNKFTEIVSRVPKDNETDVQKKSSEFAVQQLILRYFAQVIEAVHICYDSNKVTKVITDFINHIRFKPEDRKQTLIDKSKIRVILALSSTECWTNPAEREALQDLFSDQLKAAVEGPSTVDYVSITLASLFFAVRNDFIVQFIPILEEIYHRQTEQDNKEAKTTLSRLLLTVAFTFPAVFVDDKNQLILELMNSELIGPRERLFTFAHYLRENEEDLCSLMEEPDFPIKSDIIMTYLKIAIEAKTKDTGHVIDDEIYPSRADFSVVRKLLSLISENEIKQKLTNISDPLIKCYALYSTPDHHITDLEDMFNIVLPCGFKVPAMRATYELRKSPGFEIVPNLFNSNSIDDEQTKNDIFELRQFATSVSNITNLKIEEVNQDTLAAGYSMLIDFSEKYNINEIIPELLYGLVNIHEEYKNTIEQALAIVKLCSLYQPTQSLPTEEQTKVIPFLTITKSPSTNVDIYMIEKTRCKNFREILIALYLKAVELFAEGNCIYPAYALPIIETIKQRCVIPNNITKPLSKILEIESKVYDLSKSNDQVYFFFYRVLFTGNGFDESLRDKAMMYRTNGFLKADQFMKKLSLMFPGSQCFQSEKQFEDAVKEIDPVNGMCILITNADPANEEEVDNPFFMKDIRTKPKFAFMYQSNNGLHVFKTQISKNLPKYPGMANEFSISQIKQTYYFTEDNFPNYSRRLNVLRTVERVLPPIQTACYMMTQQVEEFLVLINTFSYYTQHKSQVDGGSIGGFRMKIKGTVEASVNGGIKNYIDAFFTEEYIRDHPDDQVYVDKLKEILGQLMQQVEIALQTIEPFCKDDNQQKQQISNKESYQELLNQMREAGVKV